MNSKNKKLLFPYFIVFILQNVIWYTKYNYYHIMSNISVVFNENYTEFIGTIFAVLEMISINLWVKS